MGACDGGARPRDGAGSHAGTCRDPGAHGGFGAGSGCGRTCADDRAAARAFRSGSRRAPLVDVRVTVPPEVPADPVLVATAFRIVQEALTNAARYAPGSRVEVALETSGDRLAVTVVDDGGRRGGDLRYDATADDHRRAVPTGGAEALEGGGFGLVGLAERVRALGGDVAAGPAPGGGFAVSARLPTRAGAPA